MNKRGVTASRAILAGLFIAASACSVATPATTASPTDLTARSPSTSPSVLAAPVVDDRFGFVTTSLAGASLGSAVRAENDPRPTHNLTDALGSPSRTAPTNYQTTFSYGLAVSPDGGRLAYWTAIGTDQFALELVMALTPGVQPRTVVTLTPEFGDVVGESVVWSSDGKDLVFAVGTSPLRCGADAPACPPKRAALFVLELAGGKPREIASARGNTLVPVAWDRQAHLVAAFEFEGEGGRVLAYDLVNEDGTLTRTPMVIGTGGTVTVAASHDAKQVLAHEYSSPGQVVRVWPLASPDRAVVLSPRGEQVIAPARWRPGTAEIGVMFADRLELWDTAGGRGRVALPTLPPSSEGFRPFLFRPDGRAAFVGRYFQTPSYVAVEIASGRSAVIPGEDWLSASVRVRL